MIITDKVLRALLSMGLDLPISYVTVLAYQGHLPRLLLSRCCGDA